MTPKNLLIAYLLLVVAVQALFAAVPGIDLAVSAVFAERGGGFPWASGLAPEVNLALRRIGEIATFLLLVGILYGLMTPKVRGDQIQLLAYPFLCVVLACGVLVNLLLKSHSGRARPDALAEFGGNAQFTPPWQLADECTRNCSFASGEVAMAASLAIPAVVILWPHLAPGRARVLAVILAAAYVALSALLRIGLGRHFLSDTVFSTLIAAGVAFALYPVLNIARARMRLAGLVSGKPDEDLVEQRGVY